MREPRAKGTGNLRERTPGVWQFKAYRGTDRSGRPCYSYRTFKGSKKQAELELLKFVIAVGEEVKAVGADPSHRKDLQQSSPRVTEIRNVDELLDAYISQKKRCRDTTKARYRQYARNVSRELGNYQIDALSAETLERVYARLLKSGGDDGKGLSGSTLHNINSLIGAAYRWGIGRGKTHHDPTVGLDLSADDEDFSPTMQVLSVEQTNQLIRQCLESDSQWAIPTLISIMTGLRRGECCALKWKNIDFARKTITVEHSLNSRSQLTAPKTKTSRRTIVVGDSLMDALKKHSDDQYLEQLQAGHSYFHEGFVATRGHGRPLLPDNLSRGFKTLLSKCGLPDIRFHDLRHTFASIVLRRKPAHVVSAYLGHANPRVTLEIYAHVLPGMGTEVAIALNEELGSDVASVLEDAA